MTIGQDKARRRAVEIADLRSDIARYGRHIAALDQDERRARERKNDSLAAMYAQVRDEMRSERKQMAQRLARLESGEA